MIKIPPNLGDPKINLTMEYLQGRGWGSNSKFRGEEEMQQHSLLVSDLLFPNHNDVYKFGHKLAWNHISSDYLY